MTAPGIGAAGMRAPGIGAAGMRAPRLAALGVVFALLLAGVTPATATATERLPEHTQGYIVMVDKTRLAEVRAKLRVMKIAPTRTFSRTIAGFALRLSASSLQRVQALPGVLAVERDGTATVQGTQSDPPSWGLDRLDQSDVDQDYSFTYPDQAGSGVRIYVLDTGVQADNPDFSGRITAGFNATSEGSASVDCLGHGTHVAGTAAGTRFGVAKLATIVPVKVIGCNSQATNSSIIAGMEWVLANHPAGSRGVVNMSLGGGISEAMNSAVDSLVAAGIVVVAAAGNDDVDACGFSPGSAAKAITVGSTVVTFSLETDRRTDFRLSNSNYGDCVDIFAPGSEIVSASSTPPNSYSTQSGTSMAAPHVAGAAALLLSMSPTISATAVSAALTKYSLAGVVSDSKSAANNLLNISFMNELNLPPDASAPSAPQGLSVSDVRAESAVLAWQKPASNGGSAAVSYTVNYRKVGGSDWREATVAKSPLHITGLDGDTEYEFKVSADNLSGTSPDSLRQTFTTNSAAETPGAPVLAPVVTTATAADVSWSPAQWPDANNPLDESYVLRYGRVGVAGFAGPYTLDREITNFAINDLSGNRSYWVSIEASSRGNLTQPSRIEFTTPPGATPSAPTLDPPGQPNSIGAVLLTWTPGATKGANVSGYLLQVAAAADAEPVWSDVDTLREPEITLAAPTPEQGARKYRVLTKSDVGTSDPSNVVTVATWTPPVATRPAAPKNITAVARASEIILTWKVPASDGGSPLLSYSLKYSTDGGLSWQSTEAIAAGDTPVAGAEFSYSLAYEMAPGAELLFAVAATNAVGTSNYWKFGSASYAEITEPAVP